jgi:Protein of unknown function (DUF3276)
VENERNSRKLESVYSKKVRAGKRRTYFFDVRRTKGEDYFLTLTESSRKMEGGYERHKIFLYKEDFNRFIQSLEETIDYIKTELMPQYDYDEFARRQEEYEARIAAEGGQEDDENRPPRPPRDFRSDRFQRTDNNSEATDNSSSEPRDIKPPVPPVKKETFGDSDDDMSW